MKIKLLYITNGIKGAAGLERVLAVKASYLADKLGYEVHILTLNHNNDPIFYDFSPKIILHDIAVSGNPLLYIKKYSDGIKAAVNKINPDVISVCDDGLKGFFLPILLGNKRPIIYERHISKIIELGENPSFLKKKAKAAKFVLMNKLAKGFDRFIVLTQDNVKEWDLNNIQVISNPLSFYPAESAALTNKTVIAVGKHSFQKGFDILLDSWVLVHKKNPGWKLEVYGKANEALGLKAKAKQLGIGGSVHFFDPVKEIEQKYMASSIFAFSSRFEGFGMVLIEAMACGVPCVSFDCPCGPSDIISNDEDGFLIPNGNAILFAAKLNELIENQTLRIEMGTKAKTNVKRYLPETIVPLWDSLFKTLVK